MQRALPLLALLAAACVAPPPPRAERQVEVRALLSRVDAADGITRREAQNIGEAYFLTHVGCGVYEGISDSPEFWVVEGLFGYAAKPIKGFTINKNTGAVSSPVGPSYKQPHEMLR